MDVVNITEAQAIASGVTGAIGVAFSLFFKFFPGVKGWFSNLKPDIQGLIQVAIVTAVVLAQYGLDAAGAVEIYPDGWPGIFLAFGVWVIGLAGNQSTYQSTKNIGRSSE